MEQHSCIDAYLTGKGRDFKKYSNRQLEYGISIEKEHTNNKCVARRIALDHLEEFPNYYTHLKKMEREMEKEKSKTQQDTVKNQMKWLSSNVNTRAKGRLRIDKKIEKKYRQKK